jgi:hypothetical protein
MKHVDRILSSFEAYCFNCKVTFPVETQRCLHCGERVVSAGRKKAGNSLDQITKQFAAAARQREQKKLPTELAAPQRPNVFQERVDARLPSSVPAAPEELVEEVDEEPPPRRFSPLTMIWVALAFAGAALRDCNGG